MKVLARALLITFLLPMWGAQTAHAGSEMRESLTDVEATSCSEKLCYELSASQGVLSQLGDIMYFASSSGAVTGLQGELLFRWSDTPSYLDFKSQMLVIPSGQGHAEAKYFQL